MDDRGVLNTIQTLAKIAAILTESKPEDNQKSLQEISIVDETTEKAENQLKEVGPRTS